MRWVPINSGSSSRSSRLLSSGSLLSSLALIIYWGPLYFVISSVSKRDYYVQGVPTSSALPHIFWINSGFLEFFPKISLKSGHKNWGFMKKIENTKSTEIKIFCLCPFKTCLDTLYVLFLLFFYGSLCSNYAELKKSSGYRHNLLLSLWLQTICLLYFF